MLDLPKISSWEAMASKNGDAAILMSKMDALDLSGMEITPFWFEVHPHASNCLVIGSDKPICALVNLTEEILTLAEQKKSITLIEIAEGAVDRVTHCQPRDEFQPLS